MKGTERFYTTMPEDPPTDHEFNRVAPNEGHFPIDAKVHVRTEDGHVMRFGIVLKGPQQKDYLITLIDSQPPITTHTPDEKEIYVEGDRIVKGHEFRLASHYPSFSKTAFKAMDIFTE